MSRVDGSGLSEKEKAALDRKMEQLQPTLVKAKNTYDSLTAQYRELLELRYPEKKEERVKEALYRAYSRSNRSLEEILAFMESDRDEWCD